MSKHTIDVVVNGEALTVDIDARRLLADFIRDDLNLTGTKRGCETGICGACSVIVDGKVIKSCLSLAVQVNGKSITTIEGLSCEGELHPVQEAFLTCGGMQCGYCTPGFIMTTTAMLDQTPDPSEAEIRKGLNGNLCRCTGYVSIVESVQAAAHKLAAK
ncbi:MULTISPECIES: (2Fe-2S)-binding protein [unclassified Pusillimonas]|uniref:(2Fe-2S)-binding protein n=1 Tax=unclassified Pusillimonas TaxID=2640016 RepID=UPI000B9CF7AF|nr:MULTISPECIES: (2Fe-2S)-binding protein [unclassified Pusillimonas]OXR50528.1 ferredoxin [Pusillimonas sp. T2]ROT45551.1 ferredoxin [Pusillimonas sp. NJUB218]